MAMDTDQDSLCSMCLKKCSHFCLASLRLSNEIIRPNLGPKQRWLLWKWIQFITDASWPDQIQASLNGCPSCFSPSQCFSWRGIRIRIHSAPCRQRNDLAFVQADPAWVVKLCSLVLGPKQRWLLWSWCRLNTDASLPGQIPACLHGCPSCFSPTQCFSWRRIGIRNHSAPCGQRNALTFVQPDSTWVVKFCGLVLGLLQCWLL